MAAPVAVGLIGVAVAAGLTVVSAADYVNRTAQAVSAADNAALAAADGAYLGLEAEPCALAAEVVAAHKAQMLSCAVQEQGAGFTVQVVVQMPLRQLPALPAPLGRARAGW